MGFEERALDQVVAAPGREVRQDASEDLGQKTFGWLLPLSIAGHPNSVNQIGFDCGVQAAGDALDAARAVVVRFAHQLKNPCSERPMAMLGAVVTGVRTCVLRSCLEA